MRTAAGTISREGTRNVAILRRRSRGWGQYVTGTATQNSQETRRGDIRDCYLEAKKFYTCSVDRNDISR
jgi:hypothetical protein